MSDRSLDEMLDQLYAADPSDFVALRKQLQGELRGAGKKPEAALLGRARRPSTAMWAVNQLVRRRPELVETLLTRSDELRAAQARPRADPDALREAIRAHRTAVAEAADAAVDVLGSRANEAFREEILSTLRAASSQPDVGRELRAGRLVRSDDVTLGFPEVGDVAPGPSAPSKTRAEPARADATAEKSKREAERQAALALDRALQDEATADAAAAAAQRRVDELGEQLASARDELRDARSRARKARAEAAALRRAR
jgi:hypothetical protein